MGLYVPKALYIMLGEGLLLWVQWSSGKVSGFVTERLGVRRFDSHPVHCKQP